MASEVQPPSKDEPVDPTLMALMEQNFGPADGAPAPQEDRVQRGLDAVSQLEGGGMQIRWLHESAPPQVPPPAPNELPARVCFRCGAAGATASCARCGVAGYCSRECQTADWGKKGAFGGHKAQCARYRLLGRAMRVAPDACRTIVAEVLNRTRLYVCPFAVHHTAAGAGFAFLQSECTLAELALPAPRDCCGRPLTRPRAFHLMYMGMDEFGEYEAAMAAHGGAGGLPSREVLAAAVAARAEDELLLLLTTADGLVALLSTPVVPELRVCRALAADYEGKPALQLDLDDL